MGLTVLGGTNEAVIHRTTCIWATQPTDIRKRSTESNVLTRAESSTFLISQ